MEASERQERQTSMRKTLLILVAAVIAAKPLVYGQSIDVSKVIAAAREALGGDRKLAAVKTLSAKGQSMRSMGQFQMSGDVELSVELPDKYVRQERLSM